MELLLNFVVLVVIFGVLYYVITLIPLPQPFKLIAFILLGLFFVIFLLKLFGMISMF